MMTKEYDHTHSLETAEILMRSGESRCCVNLTQTLYRSHTAVRLGHTALKSGLD